VQLRSKWFGAEAIESGRLTLEPLRVGHAEEMISVLGDPKAYAYMGGDPPSLEELRARYARQVAGQSGDGSQGWLNWIIRERDSQLAVGTVQATLRREQASVSAELAWIVAVAHQRRGYATEAASAVVEWLRGHGVETFGAHIHPGHEASEGVARRLGLTSTGAIRGGETRWVSGAF
jgi:RimJ/RimL family protein N-acetyltransferase